jgi:YegS/Rv2252/BmrU family lipid kinase
MKRTAAIVNPRAASGGAAREWPRFVEALGLPEARFTERAGHAREIARELIEAGYERILAVGGDGTVSETVNGYLRDGAPVRPQVELGLIPMGTGGDFRRSLGLRDARHAVEVIQSGRARTIDAGHIEFTDHEGSRGERYFINLASFGMGGEVAARAKNFLSPASGKAAFLWATLGVFFRYRAKTVELSVDGGEWRPHRILNIAVGNGRYHGGGMHVCPKAALDDGALDVTVIDDLGLFTLAKDLPVLYSENLYVHPKTRWAQGRSVEARSAGRVAIEVDGEPLGVLPVKIRVIPGAVRILAPR